MEVDITEKVKRVLKFGPLALVALAILCALGVWAYQHSQKGLTVYDAKVASTMVGVKAKADGTITELVVQDGDHVEAGDVIARVQVKITDEQIAQLAQNAELAKQNLAQVQRGQTVTVPQSAAPAPMPVPQSSGNSQAVANARARLNRMNELYEMGAISAVKRDQAAADLAAAEAAATPAPAVSAPAATRYQTMTQPANPEAVKQAELAVKQAQAALENAKQDSQATEIVAPVSGTVYLGDDIQEGADLKAGATVASIGDASNIWVEARLSPNQKGKIRLGQFVSYTIEGKKYQGTVLDIVDTADAQPDTAASGSLPAASEEKDEAVQTSSISEDAGNVSGDETEDSKSGNTEGNAPDMSDGRLIVKVSLPKDMADTLRPGTDAVVRFSSAN